MKKITTFACGALLLCSGIMFVGCKEDLKTFDANKISVGATTVVYNGKDQAFSVSYPNVETQVKYSLDNKSFVSVEELDLENVCEHDIYYKLSADGYEDYVGGPINFKINPRDINVKIKPIFDYVGNRRTESQVVNSIVLEYEDASDLVKGDTLNIVYDIDGYNKDTATSFYNYPIVGEDRDDNYNITIEGSTYRLGDKVIVETSTGGISYYSTIESAVKNAEQNSVIKLSTDIEDEVVISATTANVKFTLDLNGYNIKNGMKIQNHDGNANNATNYALRANIINTSKTQSSIGSITNAVGLVIDGNENFMVNLNNVSVFGSQCAIKTSEIFKGSIINADSCSFGNEQTNGYGASLLADYTYNFTNCKFKGLSAYFTQIGTHTLEKCELWGTRVQRVDFNSDSYGATGSALIVNSASCYTNPTSKNHLIVVKNSTLHSVASYALEEIVENGVNDYLTLIPSGENVYDVTPSLNGPVLIINNQSVN